MDVQFSCLQGFCFLFQGPTSNGIKANFIESCKPESNIDINAKSIYLCIVIASPKGVAISFFIEIVSSSCNFGTPRNDSSGTFALIIK
jgi:hypothetical protein